MNDPSPSFESFLVLVSHILNCGGMVIVMLGHVYILIVSLWTLFLPFLQSPTRFFFSFIPFQVAHLRTLSHTKNTPINVLETMYRLKYPSSFSICRISLFVPEFLATMIVPDVVC